MYRPNEPIADILIYRVTIFGFFFLFFVLLFFKHVCYVLQNMKEPSNMIMILFFHI